MKHLSNKTSLPLIGILLLESLIGSGCAGEVKRTPPQVNYFPEAIFPDNSLVGNLTNKQVVDAWRDIKQEQIDSLYANLEQSKWQTIFSTPDNPNQLFIDSNIQSTDIVIGDGDNTETLSVIPVYVEDASYMGYTSCHPTEKSLECTMYINKNNITGDSVDSDIVKRHEIGHMLRALSIFRQIKKVIGTNVSSLTSAFSTVMSNRDIALNDEVISWGGMCNELNTRYTKSEIETRYKNGPIVPLICENWEVGLHGGGNPYYYSPFVEGVIKTMQ
jgi:hypothetical protein